MVATPARHIAVGQRGACVPSAIAGGDALHRRGQALHGVRVRVRPELTVHVRSPALYRAVAKKRTGELPGPEDAHRVGDAGHGGGGLAIAQSRMTEPPVAVVAPALDFAAYQDSARVVLSSGGALRRRYVLNLHGFGAVGYQRVGLELAQTVDAPAPHGAVREDGARVLHARPKLRRCRDVLHGHGGFALLPAAVAELIFSVPAPAFYRAVCQQRTRVRAAKRDARRRRDAFHEHGGRALPAQRNARVPQLPLVVTAPARDRAVVQTGARMGKASVDARRLDSAQMRDDHECHREERSVTCEGPQRACRPGRRATFETLGMVTQTDEILDPDVVAVLGKGLDDEDAIVVRNATFAISRLGAKASSDSIIDQIDRNLSHWHHHVRGWSIEALQRLENPRAMELALSYLMSARWDPALKSGDREATAKTMREAP